MLLATRECPQLSSALEYVLLSLLEHNPLRYIHGQPLLPLCGCEAAADIWFFDALTSGISAPDRSDNKETAYIEIYGRRHVDADYST